MINNSINYENPNFPDYIISDYVSAVNNVGTGIPLSSTVGSVVNLKSLTVDPLNPTIQLINNPNDVQINAIQTMQDTYNQSVLQAELDPMVAINQNQPILLKPILADNINVPSELLSVENSSSETQFTVRRSDGNGQLPIKNLTGYHKLNYNLGIFNNTSTGQNNVVIGRASMSSGQTGDFIVSTPLVDHSNGNDLPDQELIVTATYPDEFLLQSTNNSNAVINMNNVVLGWFDNNNINGSYLPGGRNMAGFTGDVSPFPPLNLGNSPFNCKPGAFNASTGNNVGFYFGGRVTMVGTGQVSTAIPLFSSSIGSSADINLSLNTNCFHTYSSNIQFSVLQYNPAIPANHSFYKIKAEALKTVIPGGIVSNTRFRYTIELVYNTLTGDSTLLNSCPGAQLLGSSSFRFSNNLNPASIHGGANGVFVYWFYNQYQTCRYDPLT